MSYIVARHLVKHYGRGEGTVEAVRGISFEISAGEFVAMMGESGAGKSTVLSIMGAMNAPTAGRYIVDGIDVYGLKREKRADFRREFLGFIFQSFHLIPYLTVAENVLVPLTIAAVSTKERKVMAHDALDRVGLLDKAHRLPGQISGGEKERVAIARAIVNDPPVLMADEPTGNLDTKTSGEIMGLLHDLNGDGMTIVMVTHSQECAGYAARTLKVSDGRLLSEGGSQTP